MRIIIYKYSDQVKDWIPHYYCEAFESWVPDLNKFPLNYKKQINEKI